MRIINSYHTKLFFIFFLSTLCLSNTYSQATFQFAMGGPGIDRAQHILTASDSNYLVAGFYAGAAKDILVVKMDNNSQILWAKTYGGSFSEDAVDMKETSDGGYIITGTTGSYGAGANDIFLLRTDALGDILWFKTYGGNNHEFAASVEITSDGGFLITGTTQSFGPGVPGFNNLYIIKTDNSGNLTWATSYGTIWPEAGFYGIESASGGYIIAATTNANASNGLSTSSDIWLLKLDISGNIIWQKTYYINGCSQAEWPYVITELQDESIVIGGNIWHCGANFDSDALLFKTDNSGNVLWAKAYGNNTVDEGRDFSLTQDGGFIIGGYTSGYNAHLIKTNSQGNVQWYNVYGITNKSEECVSLSLSSDGGIIMAGHATQAYGSSLGYHHVYVVKTDNLGNVGCNETTTPLSSTNVIFSSTQPSYTTESAGTSNSYAPTQTSISLSDSVICFTCDFPDINAGDSITILEGESATINASAETGTYTWQPAIGLSCVNCLTPVASPLQTTTYYITVTNDHGCSSTDSITVYVEIPKRDFFMPNVFSPNGDGTNDILTVNGKFKTIELAIFNRWGEKVFETNDANIGWDGRYKNEILNTSIFTYHLRATLTDDTEINKKGNITLLK